MDTDFTLYEVISFMNSDTLYTHCIYLNKNNNLCQKKSINNNGFCTRHQKYVDDLDKMYLEAKKNIVTNVKKFLDDCQYTFGKENKEKVCMDLFYFLSKNQYFLYRNPSFAYSLFKKLLSFEQEERNILDTTKYINKLFPKYNLMVIEVEI